MEDKMILMRENFPQRRVVVSMRALTFFSVNALFVLMPAKKTREKTYHTHTYIHIKTV